TQASGSTAASTAASTVGTATGAKKLSVSIGEPAAIDPGLAQEIEGAQVIRLLFLPLVALDPALEVVPGVATKWSVSDDGLTWTFDLDPDAVFSDGRPVVAGDFVFAFARSADPDLAAPAAYQGLPIKGWADVSNADPSGKIGDVPVTGVRAVDDHTLTIETEAPFALLPKVLTYPIFDPVAPEYVSTDAKAAAYADQPIGNGPYTMVGPWQHNVGITVAKNPAYSGPAGIADEIEFTIYSDADTAYKDFKAGNLDIARNVPADDVADARSFADRFLVTPTGALNYIGFPTNVTPFDNPDIRLALSLAVDRDGIAERIWSGTQIPATGMVPAQVPGALQTVCDGCTYDPDRAKQLYAAAGGIPGNKIVLYDIADDGQAGLEPIINSWKDLFGLDVEVRSFEFAQYLEETAAGKAVGPFELGWVWDYPSMYSFLSPLFESTSDANNFGYSNPAFDALLEQARTAKDEAAGLPFLTKAQGIVEKDLPLIPEMFGEDGGVYDTRLSNVKVDTGALWRLELIDVDG
ncbi:MAG: 4-phytase, partial [Ilumatobacteraceae bacterium]|nr:4-phytase [Ilumatobacteraceae bacterium]